MVKKRNQKQREVVETKTVVLRSARRRGMGKRVKRSPSQLPPQNLNGHIHLSKCAKEYARCLVNPFTGPLACVPDMPAMHSRRIRVFTRGTMATSSTTGWGFAVGTPYQQVASDAVCGFYTSSNFAGTNIVLTTATTGVNAMTSNSDYALASFGAGSLNNYRVVGSGLRVRYSGTELNRGGQIYCLQQPNHGSVNNLTAAQMLAYAEARKLPAVNKEWTTVLHMPTSGGQSFSNATPSAATDQTVAAFTAGTNYLGILINAPVATTSVPYEFEFYSVIEVIGPTVQGKTPSHVDLPGIAAVHSVAQFGTHLYPHQQNTETKDKGFLSDIGKYLVEGISWVGQNAEKLVEGVGGFLTSVL